MTYVFANHQVKVTKAVVVISCNKYFTSKVNTIANLSTCLISFFSLGSILNASAQKTGRSCHLLRLSHLGLLENANVWVGNLASSRAQSSWLRLLVTSSCQWSLVKRWKGNMDSWQSRRKKCGSQSPKGIRWNMFLTEFMYKKRWLLFGNV